MTEYEMEGKIIKDVLEREGIKLNPEKITIEAIIDYMAYWPADYSIYEWIEDTKMNEPDCFIKEV